MGEREKERVKEKETILHNLYKPVWQWVKIRKRETETDPRIFCVVLIELKDNTVIKYWLYFYVEGKN